MSSDYLYGLIEYFDSSYRDNQQANFNSRGELSCSEGEIAIECSRVIEDCYTFLHRNPGATDVEFFGLYPDKFPAIYNPLAVLERWLKAHYPQLCPAVAQDYHYNPSSSTTFKRSQVEFMTLSANNTIAHDLGLASSVRSNTHILGMAKDVQTQLKSPKVSHMADSRISKTAAHNVTKHDATTNTNKSQYEFNQSSISAASVRSLKSTSTALLSTTQAATPTNPTATSVSSVLPIHLTSIVAPPTVSMQQLSSVPAPGVPVINTSMVAAHTTPLPFSAAVTTVAIPGFIANNRNNGHRRRPTTYVRLNSSIMGNLTTFFNGFYKPQNYSMTLAQEQTLAKSIGMNNQAGLKKIRRVLQDKKYNDLRKIAAGQVASSVAQNQQVSAAIAVNNQTAIMGGGPPASSLPNSMA